MNDMITIESNGSILFSKLYQAVRYEYSNNLNPGYTYEVACNGLIAVLIAYENQYMHHAEFNLIGHVSDGVQEYLLTYQMAKIFVGSLDQPNIVQTLSIKLDYAYNPQQFQQIVQTLPVESNIQLKSVGESPVFSDGRAGLSSLDAVKILTEVKGVEVQHKTLLRAIKRAVKNIGGASVRHQNVTYETVESTYLNEQGQQQPYVWMSRDLALLIFSNHSNDVTTAIIGRMNQLEAIVNANPMLPSVEPIIMDTCGVVVPEFPQAYYSIEQAVDHFGGTYDKLALQQSGNRHCLKHLQALYNGNSVEAYHVGSKHRKYDIQPNK